MQVLVGVQVPFGDGIPQAMHTSVPPLAPSF